MRRHGEKTSAALIAKEAGITKPIIYRHFTDIDDLYRALADRYRATLTQQTLSVRPAELDRTARYRTVIAAYLKTVEEVPNFWRFVMAKGRGEGGEYGALSWFAHGWAVDLAAYFVLEAGDQPDSVRASVLGFGLIGALQGVVGWWLQQGCPDREAVAQALADLFVHGLPQQVVQPPLTC